MIKKKIKKILDKKNKTKIVCLTSYSGNTASILDKHCDIILVGDSMANVLYGMTNTNTMTLEQMISHSISVKKKIRYSLLVVDMPKNTYLNAKDAKKNAKLILKKTGCDAVKIESNKKNYNIIKNLVSIKFQLWDISIYATAQKKIQSRGKSLSQKKTYKRSSRNSRAGAFSIVLECVSEKTAEEVTNSLKIPTIGIGSSKKCDGQILVTDDLLGLSVGFTQNL